MWIEQPPKWFRLLYPHAFWRMDSTQKAVYLTFDDGPIPDVTPWVIQLLDRYHIKATFFMVGDNVRKHPQEFAMVKAHAHRLGNHTFNHNRGFDCSTQRYIDNVQQANSLIETDLFRPPHGHMRWSQYRALRHQYHIVKWDLVTRDYSCRLTPEEVLENVKRYVRNGSIITFHDSIKSWSKLQYALPKAIEWLLAEGYTFKVFGE